MFPPPVTLSTQECLAQPMVIFTRDVVMRAVMTTPAYAQRLIDTARATDQPVSKSGLVLPLPSRGAPERGSAAQTRTCCRCNGAARTRSPFPAAPISPTR